MVRLVKAAKGNGSVAGELLSPVKITTTGQNSRQLNINVGNEKENDGAPFLKNN
jgi:hypothetical protein